MSDVLNVCFWSSAVQAPLKLKAPRGAPTPINRNQANQPRSASALLGKRPFDSVSFLFLFALVSLLSLSLSFCLSSYLMSHDACCTTKPLTMFTVFSPAEWRTLIFHQWEALCERHENVCPISHKAPES